MSMLELHDVHVHFPLRQVKAGGETMVRAVNGVSLSVEKGQTLGLVGESGCGKSTLSRAIMQLQGLSRGRIILNGEELNLLPERQLRARRLDFQMVFQDPYASLNPRFSIFATLAEALRQRASQSLSKRDKESAVAELMERVGLAAHHMHKYPHEFSGGQRQRIAIARAIAPRPALILADEPVSALDVSIQSQILNLLCELQRDLGLTMIFISHDLSVVRYMSDHIAVMQRGQIVEYGAAEEVFHHPQHRYTQQLLAAIPHS